MRDGNLRPAFGVTWSSKIIEKDARPGQEGRPCLDDKGFLVSMTAMRAKNSGVQGDCDQSKWVDALTVPAFVLPGGSQFAQSGAGVGNVIVGLTLHQPRQIALGIVGDIGPHNKIGEASVEMNRILNGLPPGAIPTNRIDAENRFQGPKTLFMVLPGQSNRISQPINAESVKSSAEARFNAWGGMRDSKRACRKFPRPNSNHPKRAGLVYNLILAPPQLNRSAGVARGYMRLTVNSLGGRRNLNLSVETKSFVEVGRPANDSARSRHDAENGHGRPTGRRFTPTQAVVAAGSLLVFAADVVQAPNDNQQLEPMLDKIKALAERLAAVETLLADAGYFSAANDPASRVHLREKFR